MSNFKTANANVGGREINAEAQDAARIQGRAVTSDAPTDGQTYMWDTATSTWVLGYPVEE